MAELTITPEEIRVALDKFVENFNPDGASRDEVGTVATSGDGIARVEGLPSAMANELLKFENGTLGIALATVMLAFLMMITRKKAVTQVVGFLAMENGLFLAATSATYGMPMVVEFGIALDVLVGAIILGVFFFQIRDQFDSLDIHHMERLKDS